MLILDAFSGDSIPVHLLTVEGIREYKNYVNEKGILLFHVSNRYVDIVPVLFRNAKEVGASALLAWNNFGKFPYFATTWVILTWNPQVKDILISKLGWEGAEFFKNGEIRKVRPWTDKYSNILSAIRLKNLLEPVKDFKLFSW